MPRQARLIPPGVVVHIVCRFVNSEFRIRDSNARDDYLVRLGTVAERTDWEIIHFAVMSTHIHLIGVSGEQDLEGFIKPLHIGTASALNKAQNRHGPVFAGRPNTVICANRAVGYVIAYVSNNPRRAGLVEVARDSQWTSHDLYLDPGSAPKWLQVERGLELAGFSTSEKGRRGFDDFVNSLRWEPRNDALSERALPSLRRKAREKVGAPVELGVPVVDMSESGLVSAVSLVTRVDVPVRPRGHFSLEDVLAVVAGELSLAPADLRSRDRRRELCAGRRVAVLVWVRYLNRPSSEIAGYLGISTSAASGLLHRRPDACRALQPVAEGVVAKLIAS
ncbi:MAG: hypothetical protein DRJ42_29475 [Deltaproteobacteria bacterium]|nr:MAG: hypothetical protein DRJ42_29475 [Deltaproteobacteria bacterium]